MRDTSLETYKQLREEGVLGSREIEVLEAIRDNPMQTDQELTEILGYDDPNVVRPRRKALYDYKVITDCGKKKCSITGRKAYTWIWNNQIDLATIINNQRELAELKNDVAFHEVLVRTIKSKSLMEAVAKAMKFVNDYPIKDNDVILKQAYFHNGIYIIRITRTK